MRKICIAAVIAMLLLAPSKASAIDVFYNVDAYWSLIHEPKVLDELGLTADQRVEVQKLTDELDLQLFPYRNKSRDEVSAGLATVIAAAEQGLKRILEPAQEQRLTEILLQQIRTQGLLRDDVAASLELTDGQRARIKEIVDRTQAAVTAIQADGKAGKPRDALEKSFQKLKDNELKQVAKVLQFEQGVAWKRLLGAPFDASQLGHPAFKAPELVDTGEWINSSPLRLETLRGKVVVLHFYACGCINCIHNYPSYRAWHDRYTGTDAVLIGIHTPETQSERESSTVRAKAAEEKLAFPILIDGKNENWNAWGNSMWPSVYLIDKRGCVRHFWPGELKWQGDDGEAYMRQRIEALLAEPAP